MPFQKGNKLGAKGRSKGSKNKSTDLKKFELQQLSFNIEDIKKDFQTSDAYKKFDVRMKAMSFLYSRPAVEMSKDTKPPYADEKFITDDGEDLPDDEKKRIYFESDGDGTNPIDLPLFID